MNAVRVALDTNILVYAEGLTGDATSASRFTLSLSSGTAKIMLYSQLGRTEQELSCDLPAD
jgi:predicted nucleic acid-binding protein